jgi:hypothetical protein
MSHYVTNKQLLEELEIWHGTKHVENGKEVLGRMSEKLGEYILSIATNLANKGNYCGYTYKDELIGDAILTCIKYLKNFDITISQNPFAYITQICSRCFIAHIKKQNNHSKIKQKLFDERGYFTNDLSTERGIDYSAVKGINDYEIKE